MQTSRLKLALGGACAAFAIATVATSCVPAAVPVRGGPAAAPAALFAPAGSGGTPTATPSPSAAPLAEPTASPAARPPRPAHIVIVVLENHSPDALKKGAPYLTSLAARGASFTDATAERHPSEPNYLALFSGSTHNVTDDSCPHTFAGANLASQLAGVHETFIGYAESMPSDGYTGCSHGRYARKHNPWVNFANVPAEQNLTFDRFPQGHWADLPTVSLVIPNLCNDMHDCSVGTGDAWLKTNLSGYVTWAQKHNSVLIVTGDEAESTANANQIPLIVAGGPVRPGAYHEPVNHLSVLRTIEDLYGLPCLAKACDAEPVTGIWKKKG